MGSLSERSVLTKAFDVEEFRIHAHQMVDFIADYHRDIESFPVRSQVEPGYLQKLLPEQAPDDPEPLEDILSDVQSKIVPGVTHWQSPNFFGYYPSNGSTAGFLGEMLSGGFNIVGFSWITSPAATELEMVVLDWLGKLLQLPNEFLSSGKGGGVIQGTASEAVLVVMLAARKRAVEKATKEQGLTELEALGKLVAYTSDQAHSCVNKASQIAGIRLENLRLIPTDASTNYSMSPQVLAKTVAADVAAGLVPFFLCGVVGSTSSAAVDPLPELGDIAKEYGMWFHVDGAYAGNACICPEYRAHLNGVEKADSFDMNPHKWLLTNFDCSTLWVKHPTLLVAALSTNPEFLRNKQSDNNLVVDYKDWQIPLGRRFRSLKLWMVMRMYGSTGLRAYINYHCDLAKHFEELVQSDSRFEVMAPRTFSLVCFRLKPTAADANNGTSLNSKLVEAVNSDGNILITHTVLGGVYTVRFAIGGSRTELRHVDAAWKAIELQATKLLNESCI
jgi:glutamate/tyrosine decarboxylase-like PLP-dependent enzyme